MIDRMRIHPERARRTAAVAELDPSVDWHEIYKRLTLWELPVEARLGFQLAFYRPFGVPRMAAVLHASGHLRRDATRRAYDTGLIIHEIIWGGVDSDRGRRMVDLMIKLHDRGDIEVEDMRYVLNALMVVPTRLMDRYGWRRVTPAERVATWRFYDRLGESMLIDGRATSYDDAERQFADYEAQQLITSEAGAELTAGVLKVLRRRLPLPARPLAAQITAVFVGDLRVIRALSLPEPRAWVGLPVVLGSKVRRMMQRRQPPEGQPSFWPGRPAGSVYPSGYTLDQLG